MLHSSDFSVWSEETNTCGDEKNAILHGAKMLLEKAGKRSTSQEEVGLEKHPRPSRKQTCAVLVERGVNVMKQKEERVSKSLTARQNAPPPATLRPTTCTKQAYREDSNSHRPASHKAEQEECDRKEAEVLKSEECCSPIDSRASMPLFRLQEKNSCSGETEPPLVQLPQSALDAMLNEVRQSVSHLLEEREGKVGQGSPPSLSPSRSPSPISSSSAPPATGRVPGGAGARDHTTSSTGGIEIALHRPPLFPPPRPPPLPRPVSSGSTMAMTPTTVGGQASGRQEDEDEDAYHHKGKDGQRPRRLAPPPSLTMDALHVVEVLPPTKRPGTKRDSSPPPSSTALASHPTTIGAIHRSCFTEERKKVLEEEQEDGVDGDEGNENHLPTTPTTPAVTTPSVSPCGWSSDALRWASSMVATTPTPTAATGAMTAATTATSASRGVTPAGREFLSRSHGTRHQRRRRQGRLPHSHTARTPSHDDDDDDDNDNDEVAVGEAAVPLELFFHGSDSPPPRWPVDSYWGASGGLLSARSASPSVCSKRQEEEEDDDDDEKDGADVHRPPCLRVSETSADEMSAPGLVSRWTLGSSGLIGWSSATPSAALCPFSEASRLRGRRDEPPPSPSPPHRDPACRGGPLTGGAEAPPPTRIARQSARSPTPTPTNTGSLCQSRQQKPNPSRCTRPLFALSFSSSSSSSLSLSPPPRSPTQSMPRGRDLSFSPPAEAPTHWLVAPRDARSSSPAPQRIEGTADSSSLSLSLWPMEQRERSRGVSRSPSQSVTSALESTFSPLAAPMARETKLLSDEVDALRCGPRDPRGGEVDMTRSTTTTRAEPRSRPTDIAITATPHQVLLRQYYEALEREAAAETTRVSDEEDGGENHSANDQDDEEVEGVSNATTWRQLPAAARQQKQPSGPRSPTLSVFNDSNSGGRKMAGAAAAAAAFPSHGPSGCQRKEAECLHGAPPLTNTAAVNGGRGARKSTLTTTTTTTNTPPMAVTTPSTDVLYCSPLSPPSCTHSFLLPESCGGEAGEWHSRSGPNHVETRDGSTMVVCGATAFATPDDLRHVSHSHPHTDNGKGMRKPYHKVTPPSVNEPVAVPVGKVVLLGKEEEEESIQSARSTSSPLPHNPCEGMTWRLGGESQTHDDHDERGMKSPRRMEGMAATTRRRKGQDQERAEEDEHDEGEEEKERERRIPSPSLSSSPLQEAAASFVIQPTRKTSTNMTMKTSDAATTRQCDPLTPRSHAAHGVGHGSTTTMTLAASLCTNTTTTTTTTTTAAAALASVGAGRKINDHPPSCSSRGGPGCVTTTTPRTTTTRLSPSWEAPSLSSLSMTQEETGMELDDDDDVLASTATAACGALMEDRDGDDDDHRKAPEGHARVKNMIFSPPLLSCFSSRPRSPPSLVCNPDLVDYPPFDEEADTRIETHSVMNRRKRGSDVHPISTLTKTTARTRSHNDNSNNNNNNNNNNNKNNKNTTTPTRTMGAGVSTGKRLTRKTTDRESSSSCSSPHVRGAAAGGCVPGAGVAHSTTMPSGASRRRRGGGGAAAAGRGGGGQRSAMRRDDLSLTARRGGENRRGARDRSGRIISREEEDGAFTVGCQRDRLQALERLVHDELLPHVEELHAACGSWEQHMRELLEAEERRKERVRKMIMGNDDDRMDKADGVCLPVTTTITTTSSESRSGSGAVRHDGGIEEKRKEEQEATLRGDGSSPLTHSEMTQPAISPPPRSPEPDRHNDPNSSGATRRIGVSGEGEGEGERGALQERLPHPSADTAMRKVTRGEGLLEGMDKGEDARGLGTSPHKPVASSVWFGREPQGIVVGDRLLPQRREDGRQADFQRLRATTRNDDPAPRVPDALEPINDTINADDKKKRNRCPEVSAADTERFAPPPHYVTTITADDDDDGDDSMAETGLISISTMSSTLPSHNTPAAAAALRRTTTTATTMTMTSEPVEGDEVDDSGRRVREGGKGNHGWSSWGRSGGCNRWAGAANVSVGSSGSGAVPGSSPLFMTGNSFDSFPSPSDHPVKTPQQPISRPPPAPPLSLHWQPPPPPSSAL